MVLLLPVLCALCKSYQTDQIQWKSKTKKPKIPASRNGLILFFYFFFRINPLIFFVRTVIYSCIVHIQAQFFHLKNSCLNSESINVNNCVIPESQGDTALCLKWNAILATLTAWGLKNGCMSLSSLLLPQILCFRGPAFNSLFQHPVMIYIAFFVAFFTTWQAGELLIVEEMSGSLSRCASWRNKQINKPVMVVCWLIRKRKWYDSSACAWALPLILTVSYFSCICSERKLNVYAEASLQKQLHIVSLLLCLDLTFLSSGLAGSEVFLLIPSWQSRKLLQMKKRKRRKTNTGDTHFWGKEYLKVL